MEKLKKINFGNWKAAFKKKFSDEQIQARANEICKSLEGISQEDAWQQAIAALEAEQEQINRLKQKLVSSGQAAGKWQWTGFINKTLWNWMELLIVPVVLSVGAFLLQQSASDRDSRVADDRAKQQVLENYFNQISTLLTDKNLSSAAPDSQVFILAQARTIAALRELDSRRQTLLLQFLKAARLAGSQPASEGDILLDTLYDRKRISLLENAYLSGINLSGVTITTISLREANLSKANLSKANLDSVDLYEINLSSANLSNATFSVGVDLTKANLENANLSNANLEAVELNYTKLHGVNLRGANLKRAELYGAEFDNGDLSFADLRDVSFMKPWSHDPDELPPLSSTSFSNANLSFANLEGTNLSGVDFREANLIGANLIGADLTDADLQGANILEIQLIGAQICRTRFANKVSNRDCPNE